ncbi:ribonuclease J [Candidatus Woesebacteria bacterium]|nr:ribonuclease J [Candidatus Woesebacteria bacterium]
MSKLRIIPLGGMGNVTQNMYLYEYDNEILIVDCGIGFPDSYMPGVDILIPDITFLLSELEAGKKIVGMLLTHGHDDHIAALPYLIPNLPDFQIYGSPLTAGFAEQRMRDSKDDKFVNVVEDNTDIQIGEHFSVKFFPVTHSVPDTRHIAITTPEGIIYHGSDFKLDPTPVDGVTSDLEHISQLADKNVLCMMIDCLRVEYPVWVESESLTGPAIDSVMATTEGKLVMTLMSSHIHRIQQTINAAHKHGRKVIFIGRSVEQNVEVATRLGKLMIPEGMKVDKKHINDVADDKLCVIVAGSQGQEGSSLMRAVFGDHRSLIIKKNDTVVFSADAIPGNELTFYGAINELCRNKIHVVYPSVMPSLHKSGHASAPEQQELLSLVKPKYVMPIGGDDRHRFKFFELVASKLGFDEKHVIIPDSGEIVSFENTEYSVDGEINLKAQIIDGLGIGDVGPSVLKDRRSLGQAGIVAVIIPRVSGSLDLGKIEVVSRGFVFMREAQDVIEFIKSETAKLVSEEQRKNTNLTVIQGLIEKRISRRLYKIIRREPMIVSVFIDV